MKKLLIALGVASLFTSGMALANSDHDVEIELDDPTTVVAAPVGAAGNTNAAAAAKPTNGTLTINGTVVANTCYIDANDVNKVVNLDDIYSNQLKTAGATGNPKNFTITLRDCPIKYNGKDNVKLSFNKTSPNVDTNTGNLKDTGNAVTVAKNVQFQVSQKDGSVIDFRNPNVKKALASKAADDSIAFDFTAQYYATGVAEPGTLTSTIGFQVDYE